MRGSVGEAAAYASSRKQFGQPIASFGAIKHKIAEMCARVYASEAACYRAGQNIDPDPFSSTALFSGMRAGSLPSVEVLVLAGVIHGRLSRHPQECLSPVICIPISQKSVLREGAGGNPYDHQNVRLTFTIRGRKLSASGGLEVLPGACRPGRGDADGRR